MLNINSDEKKKGTIIKIVKDKITNSVTRIISSEISMKTNLARNTIKYHIDKLLNHNQIFLIKEGRKNKLYSKDYSFS